MASLAWSSQLMNNYVAAETLPSAKHISTCFDPDTALPLVFALIDADGAPPRFIAVKTNANGAKVSLDLLAILGLPSSTVVQAFEARQSVDGSIFLCLAVHLAERKSSVLLVKPFTTLSSTSRLEKLTPVESGQVHGFLIADTAADPASYPQVFAIHQPLNRTATVSDVSRLEIDLEEGVVELFKDLSTPVNGNVLDIATAAGGVLGNGLFFLMQNSAVSTLWAKLYRPSRERGEVGSWATYQLSCPKDACSIESFSDFGDVRKRSGVIIGSELGLHWALLKDVIAGKPGLTPLSTKQIFQKPTTVTVVQSQNDLSLWSINAKQELSMLVTTTVTMDDQRSSILLPAGQATVLSPMIYQPPGNTNCRHALVVNNAQSQMTLMQQSLDTGIWRSEPFYAATPGSKVVEMQTYTINVTAKDVASNVVPLGEVFVKPSSDLPLITNGHETILSSKGEWLRLDLSGELALIVPTTGISIQPVTLQQGRTAQGTPLAIPSTLVDPSQKVISALASLTSADALSNATTKDGKSLWEGVEKPSVDDLKGAAECFKAISQAHAEVPIDGSKVVSKAARAVKQAKMQTATAFDEVVDLFMDSYHWVKTQAEEAVDWVVKKIGDAWVFICKIGNMVKNFVLDCLEKVKEAASWVWAKIKLGWQKLTEFIGFIFSWGDILETKDTLIGLMNGGLDFAELKVESFNEKIDSFFNGMENDVRHFISLISDRKQTARLPEKPAPSKKDSEVTNDTGTGWVGERMKNDRSGQESGAVDTDDGVNGNVNVDLWKDRVQPLIRDVIGTVEQLVQDVVALFKDDHDMPLSELMVKLGYKLILDILKILRGLINTLVTSVAKLVGGLKTLCNTKMSNGFLNSLYRWLTGRDLTIFEGVAFLIAIPSTLIIKLVTGKKPPQLETTSVEFYKKLTSIESKEEKKSELWRNTMVILVGCSCGIAIVKTAVDTIKLGYKMATQDADKIVDGLSPGTVMEIITLLFEVVSWGQDLMDPPSQGTPGRDYRLATNWVTGVRISANLLYVIACKAGMENKVADKAMLCVDLLSALINVGLNTAASIQEINADSWEDYHADTSALACTENFVEAIKAVGYFTAFTFKDKDPNTTAAGLICLQVAGVSAFVVKTGSYRIQWERELSS